MSASMTRQHFTAIADDIGLSIRYMPESQQPQAQAYLDDYLLPLLLDSMRRFNTGFDRQRFVDRIEKVRKDGLK